MNTRPGIVPSCFTTRNKPALLLPSLEPMMIMSISVVVERTVSCAFVATTNRVIPGNVVLMPASETRSHTQYPDLDATQNATVVFVRFPQTSPRISAITQPENEAPNATKIATSD